MVVQIDHYVVLGLPSGGGLSKEEIKKAYRSKLLLVHHDRDDFLKLYHSYQVLKDPKSRKLFDDHLRIQREREEKVRRRRRMMSRSAASSSFAKEEDIIDVESISKITKEDNAWGLMMSRAAANSSFVKEEDIIDVESISKITPKQEDDATKGRRMMSRCAASSLFVKEEDIIDVESISKITPKQEDDDWKIWRSGKSFVKEEDIIDVKSISKISGKQEEDEGIMVVVWDLRKAVGYYTAQRLYEIFGYFGCVVKVIIYNNHGNGGFAIVTMASKDAAIAAISYGYHLGHHSNPLHTFLIGHGDPMEPLVRLRKLIERDYS